MKAFIFEIFCLGGSGGLLMIFAVDWASSFDGNASVLGVGLHLGSLLVLVFSDGTNSEVFSRGFMAGLSMLNVMSFWWP